MSPEIRVVTELSEELRARLGGLTNPDRTSDMHHFLASPPEYHWALLAEEEGRVVGWAALYGVLRDRLYLDVFVDPRHRRRGIGSLLLREARAFNCGVIILSDVPFYRRAAPDIEPKVVAGISLLTLRTSTTSSGASS